MGSLLKVLIFFAVIYFIWRLLSPKPEQAEIHEDEKSLIEDMVSCKTCGNYTLRKSCGRQDCPF